MDFLFLAFDICFGQMETKIERRNNSLVRLKALLHRLPMPIIYVEIGRNNDGADIKMFPNEIIQCTACLKRPRQR